MVKNIKQTLKSVLPQSSIARLSEWYFQYQLFQVQSNHRKALEIVRKKEKIKVAFFLLYEMVWKYDYIYKLMEQDKGFDPVIVICPITRYGEENLITSMKNAFDYFTKNGYNTIKTLNEATGEWLDVKKTIQPDIVFFTNPYYLTRPEYQIINYLDTLTCYVPYGFKNSYIYDALYNQLTHNFVWKFFLETTIHQALSKKYSRNKGKNTVVTGYPGMDSMLMKNYTPKDVWKIKDRKIKRIIWAAHHTIPGYGFTLDFSTFLKYCDIMPELAEKYKEHIQIAFKPHPILRQNLNNPEVWGRQKTDSYFKKWEDLENGQLNESDYLDLFITSDAMIHDCGSFTVEYLYTSKPVMFLIGDENITNRFNDVGKIAFNKLYHGREPQDIESFIVDVVLNNHDPKKEERIQFFNEVIKPPNNKTASENIFNIIKAEIFNE